MKTSSPVWQGLGAQSSKTLMAGIKGKAEKSQLRPGCGRCPIGCSVGKRKDGEAFKSFGAWSYLAKHPSTPLLTPDLLEKCFCNWWHDDNDDDYDGRNQHGNTPLGITPCMFSVIKHNWGTSLAVQWLILHTSTAGVTGSIPDQET